MGARRARGNPRPEFLYRTHAAGFEQDTEEIELGFTPSNPVNLLQVLDVERIHMSRRKRESASV